MKKLILLLTFLPSIASARIFIGNGGQIIQCKDASGNLTLSQAFDLYEGRALQGYQYRRENDSLDPLDLAVSVARKLDAAQGSFENLITTSPESIEGWVRYVAREMNLLPSGVGLDGTGDTQEFIQIPSNCEFVQTVNFRDSGEIHVNSDAWNSLTPFNHAALLVHEAVYAYLRQTGVENDSRRARKITAFVMAGGNYVERTELPTGLRALQYCHSRNRENGDYPTKFLAYLDRGQVTIQFLQVAGYLMLTKSTITTRIEGATESPIDVSLSKTQSLTAQVESPVDYDAKFKLKWGKGRFTIGGVVQPGNPVHDLLECEDRPAPR